MFYRFMAVVPFLFCASASHANDYPTLDKVSYVFECMALHGGESYENMYQCACVIDNIAENMVYQEYTEADTLIRLSQARGERAALLRDSPQSKVLRKKLTDIKASAEKRCFIPKVALPAEKSAPQ
ncbi:hypothetical protein [Beggiatoa leptomitoformis]|uniref:Uncharacterized protein n=1 Tax=Beggiatoa leptomitoformis TaxID=288004 RepID=A0A2N9YHK9_9GAMM|nr:hypothetical protein [Beggiatoa leptomitoformis]ALG67721.1 hypothetical protein AL038_08360 [Beggiatoa leptomitoformis]AUI70041.1 hypothetical protein BLE401_15945 [Beggiatoa leptomitoformis]